MRDGIVYKPFVLHISISYICVKQIAQLEAWAHLGFDLGSTRHQYLESLSNPWHLKCPKISGHHIAFFIIVEENVIISLADFDFILWKCVISPGKISTDSSSNGIVHLYLDEIKKVTKKF